MIVRNIGYNRVEIRWRKNGGVKIFHLRRIDSDGSSLPLISTVDNVYVDIVPDSLSRREYHYELEKDFGDASVVEGAHGVVEKAQTSLTDWCEEDLPMPILPGRPHWVAIYRKVWQLAWRGIVSSPVLPAGYAYNDYPDNDRTYLWDSCFCTMFQRYAGVQGIHPCMKTLDNFYSSMTSEGYIPRLFNWKTFKSLYPNEPSAAAINPPICAWAEWSYYQISADRQRLQDVMPKLIHHHRFIDQYLMEKSGFYRWDADGSGWDNINWDEGENQIVWYVDLLAQQAQAAHYIEKISGVVGDQCIAEDFHRYWMEKKSQLQPYWNDSENWYCSLTKDFRPTRKTLSGIWPMLAGLVDRDFAERMIRTTLLNPDCFNTSPMPLPVLAKDQPGYNPMGEYWLGGVWLNMSLVVIRALEQYGFDAEAFDLSRRTLDGVAAVYKQYESFPNSLWECYAPEAIGPSSHKIASGEVGGVREEFCGWTGVIVNLIIENVIGINVNAPANELTWDIRLNEEHGLRNLRFGDICTSLHAINSTSDKQIYLTVESTGDYTLLAKSRGCLQRFTVTSGKNRFDFTND